MNKAVIALVSRDLRKSETARRLADSRPNVPVSEMVHLEELVTLRKEILRRCKEPCDKSEVIEEFIKRFENLLGDCKFTLGQTYNIECALKQAKEQMIGEK